MKISMYIFHFSDIRIKKVIHYPSLISEKGASSLDEQMLLRADVEKRRCARHAENLAPQLTKKFKSQLAAQLAAHW